MAKKKEEETNPQIEESTEVDKQMLMQVAQNIQNATDIQNVPSNDDGSYFRGVLDKLFDRKNISAKTEYIGVRENYMGAKLTFLSKYCNLPYLEKFIDTFEEKRISLDRKGRKEILLALQERRMEQQEQQAQNFARMFGM